jgi:phage shock protein C
MKKKLTRDMNQAVIGGVLAGLAQYFNQDPVLFRILAIIFLLLTGVFPGVLIYLVAWIVMPAGTHFDYEVVE